MEDIAGEHTIETHFSPSELIDGTLIAFHNTIIIIV
jgi:hypothetical protein